MAVQRLQKELKLLNKDPVPGIIARPNPSNMLEWHYLLDGAVDSPYAGGRYHGKVVFPSQYPFRPPDIMMVTPSGRFAPNTRLCLSMSSFHPESWNPMWSVSSILSGLYSFMNETTATTGSVVTSHAEKRRLAALSMTHNAKNASFRKVFPDVAEAHARANEEGEKELAAPARGGGGPGSAGPPEARRARGGGDIREAGARGGARGRLVGNHAIANVAIVGVFVALTAMPLYNAFSRVAF